MARNQWEDALQSILTGGLQGYQQGQASSNEMAKMLMVEKLKMAMNPPEYKPRTMDEALEFERAKAGIVKPIQALQEEKTKLQIKGLEQTQEASAQKGERETDLIRSTAQSNLDTIKAIKEGKKYFGPYAGLPTLITSVGGMIDYNSRKKWENNINKLLSQKVVDLITTMKSASQTGATGFGQLSEKEGQLLREASTALSKDLDPETAMGYLNDMERLYKKIVPDYGGYGVNSGIPVSDKPTLQDLIAERQRRSRR